MPKDLTFGNESREKLLSGVKKLNDAVVATLGPAGRLVAIEKNDTTPEVTKDGYSVAKVIFLEDPIENVGAQFLKEAASKTVKVAGDNTTTSTCIAYGIIKEAYKAIDAGYKPIDIKRGIDKATKDIIDILKSESKKVSTDEEIKAVAAVSANNDPEIGGLIAEAINKVGKDSLITMEEGRDINSSIKTTCGIEFDNGYISPYFSTDKEKLIAEYDEIKVLLTDQKISAISDIMPILEALSAEGKPILIIADDVEGEALGTLVMNSVRGSFKSVAVKAPSFGENRKEVLEDIAVLTGATVISSDAGMRLNNSTTDVLGTAKVKVTKDSCTISDGISDAIRLEKRIAELKGRIENEESEHFRNKLKRRLASFTNGVAVIVVGAATEAELKEKKARVEDAICATRCAIEQGILPGGGTALVKAASKLSPKDLEEGEERGYKLLLKAISEPLKVIAENSGVNGEVVLNNVLLDDSYNNGYNAKTGEYGDMYKMEIIDTCKGISSALVNASSVAGNLIMTECTITEVVPDTPQPMLMAGPGGMQLPM